MSEARWPGPKIEVGQRVLVTDNVRCEGADKIRGKLGTILRVTSAYQEVDVDGVMYLLDSDNREIVPYWGQGPDAADAPEAYLRYKATERYRNEDTEAYLPTYAAVMAMECLRARGIGGEL